MKNIKIISLALISFLLFTNIALASPVNTGTIDKLDNQTKALTDASGFETGLGIETIVSTIIKAVLSLLGIIFVGLIIMAGFRWMTASGNEENITKAKSTLKQAIIGLLIVLAAYAITDFIFYNLDDMIGITSSETLP